MDTSRKSRPAARPLRLAAAALLLPAAALAEAPVCPDDPRFPDGFGHFTSVFKEVTIRRGGIGPQRLIPAERGMAVCRTDVVTTGPGGRARIRFTDFHRDDAADPGALNIGPDTEAWMSAFEDAVEREEPGLGVTLYRGLIRFLRGGGSSAFNVRVSPSICGIRGSDVISLHDPAAGRAEHMVAEGLMTCEAPGGPVEVRAGQRVAIEGGVIGPVTSLDPADFAAASALTDPEAAARAALPFDLPGAGALPAACSAAAEVGTDVATSRYRYCGGGESAVYASCAMTRCLTGAEIGAFLADRPGFTAEAAEGTCRPVCDAAAGFARLEYYRHGSFCGRCPDGTSWHRGHGCCR